MSTIDDRIAQWEQMAREAPDDMAYFSLGSAYRDAERFEDADAAFAKAIELNPEMSRAYQLRSQVLLKLAKDDEAADVLTRGYAVAARRGDVMPQRAMASLLQKLGRPLPEVETPRTAEDLGADQIIDRRSGRPQPRLAGPPMRGPVGQFIYDHFGQHTWREWIGQGTKVINELRLDLSDPRAQKAWDQNIREFLNLPTG